MKESSWANLDGRSWFDSATSQSDEIMNLNFLEDEPKKLVSSLWGANGQEVELDSFILDGELEDTEFELCDRIFPRIKH